jgi:hypothetical protein
MPSAPGGRQLTSSAQEDERKYQRNDRQCFYEGDTDKHRRLQRTAQLRLTSDTFDCTTYDQTVTDTCAKRTQTEYDRCCY